jgi:hypothetical protein
MLSKFVLHPICLGTVFRDKDEGPPPLLGRCKVLTSEYQPRFNGVFCNDELD